MSEFDLTTLRRRLPGGSTGESAPGGTAVAGAPIGYVLPQDTGLSMDRSPAHQPSSDRRPWPRSVAARLVGSTLGSSTDERARRQLEDQVEGAAAVTSERRELDPSVAALGADEGADGVHPHAPPRHG